MSCISDRRTRRTGKDWSRVACLVLSLAGGSSGCGRHPAVATEPAGTASPPKVSTAKPERRKLIRTIEQPARIEAFEQTPLFSKLAGYVQKVNVEMGAHVRKDDVLAELWVPEMDEQLRQKETLVSQAGIEIVQAEKTRDVAQASIATAQSLAQEAKASRKRAASAVERWRSESTRMSKLVRDKTLDVQTGEEIANQFRIAVATLEETEAKVHSAEASIREAEARRDKARADVEVARGRLAVALTDQKQIQTMLNYAKIVAPFDGVVTQRNVHTGHFLQPGTSGSGVRNEPLFIMARMDRVRVFLEVPEADAVRVNDGVAARIRVQVLNDKEFVGKVTGSSWSLDPNQRTLRTEIDFDNPGGRLRPGMYAHAVLEVPQSDAMMLPLTAILTRDGQTACFCVEDGRALRMPVRIGVRQNGEVEVLKKQQPPAHPGDKPRWVDFTGTEAIIVSNPGELSHGQPVQVGVR